MTGFSLRHSSGTCCTGREDLCWDWGMTSGPTQVCANRCLRCKIPADPLNALSPHTGFLDWVPKKMQRVGCVELLNTVQRRVQPRLHVFGHIHEGE